MRDLYYDCAGSYGRYVSSSYTSYGISCIDSEYCRRIQNIYKPVLKLIKIERVPHYKDGTYRSDYWDEYTELSLDDDYHNYDRVSFIHNEGNSFIELPDKRTEKGKENGVQYQQFMLITPEYSYTHPTYSAKHRGEDPKLLRKEIKENPHLHKLIKKNLLDNLTNYIKIHK
jgi:hypothetical protein